MDVTIIKKMPPEHVNYKLALHIHRSAKPKYFIGIVNTTLDASHINTVFPLICAVFQISVAIYKRGYR